MIIHCRAFLVLFALPKSAMSLRGGGAFRAVDKWFPKAAGGKASSTASIGHSTAREVVRQLQTADDPLDMLYRVTRDDSATLKRILAASEDFMEVVKPFVEWLGTEVLSKGTCAAAQQVRLGLAHSLWCGAESIP